MDQVSFLARGLPGVYGDVLLFVETLTLSKSH